jgi:hypothetical protein
LDIEEALELFPGQVTQDIIREWIREANITEERYFDYQQRYVRDADDLITTRTERKRKRV